jgi:hypothetical protein
MRGTILQGSSKGVPTRSECMCGMRPFRSRDGTVHRQTLLATSGHASSASAFWLCFASLRFARLLSARLIRTKRLSQ